MKGYDIFKNTYITGEGRKNYLRIDNLEDPLFTSFTFDIDYITSPLFYTISNYDINDTGLSGSIEQSLKDMYGRMKSNGYDILPLMTANMDGNNKLGFGLQKNVYTDKPLYGATEYIYMVDKRNSNQNDYIKKSSDHSGKIEQESFNLGDSVKTFITENDKKYLQAQIASQKVQKDNCDKILNPSSDQFKEHAENKKAVDYLEKEINGYKYKFKIDGEDKSISKEELIKLINENKNIIDSNKKLLKDIVDESNKKLLELQNDGKKIYEGNDFVKEIMSYKDIGEYKNFEEVKKNLAKNSSREILKYLNDFKTLYQKFVTFSGKPHFGGNENNGTSFLINDGKTTKVQEFFKLKGLSIGDIENLDNLKPWISKFELTVSYKKSTPEWVNKFNSHIAPFFDNESEYGGKTNGAEEMIEQIMSAKIDEKDIEKYINESEDLKKYLEKLKILEDALNKGQKELYGCDNSGAINDESNASPESLYGQYSSAEEKLKNDAYTQAENVNRFIASINANNQNGGNSDGGGNSDSATKNEKESTGNESNHIVPTQSQSDKKENKPKKSYVPQTVLDILGFINGMKKMTEHYPYILQNITGLDTAYKKHYFIKDSYLGSGDDKITITCLESLDLRVSSMFNRYFNAVYDRQYRRERVPINLRRFNCSVYVHDVRNFVSSFRDGKDDNRILELKGMYYSVIEFKFYDCEIVPEETGDIFNNISNEAPLDMIKTNFTFTYGNCVVNFVPYK